MKIKWTVDDVNRHFSELLNPFDNTGGTVPLKPKLSDVINTMAGKNNGQKAVPTQEIPGQ